MIDPAELEIFGRGIREATGRWRGDELDAALMDLGWLDALEADPQTAVSLVFEAQGMANTTSGALGVAMAGSLGFEGPDAGRQLVLPPLEGETPGRIFGEQCQIRGLTTPGPPDGERLLVVCEAAGRYVVVVVETADLRARPVRGLDPDLALTEVTGSVSGLAPDECSPVDWEAALALGRRAVGHELLGSSRAMLESARLHALDRVQFGRPIASFQAIRHRLADCLVAIEGADALLRAAWEDPAPRYASMAKASAGRAAQLVGRHCQQVLGGLGFTTEHPFHRHLRRSMVLDQLLGAGSTLTRRLGAEVLGSGLLPAGLEL